MMFLGDLLRRHCVLRPDTPALKFDGTTLTYREFRDQVHKLGNALVAAGVGRGDQVAVLGKNGPEHMYAYFGCAAAAAVMSCVNYRLGDRELTYVVNNTEAAVLLLDAEFVDAWERVRGDCGGVERVVIIHGAAPAGYESYTAFVEGHPTTAPDVEQHEDDVAIQMYTSGTTGVPKGAMLTHRSLIAVAIGCTQEFELGPGDTLLVAAPLYHIAAGMTALVSALVGAAVLLHREFNPIATLDAIEQDGVNNALLIPAMILFMLQMPGVEERDFSSLKQIVYGASPIPYEVLTKAMQVFKCGFIQAYGQTESSAVISFLTAADHDAEGERGERIRKSAGREILGCEARIVREDGTPCDIGEWGEVTARGPIVMKGYWKMPEATASAIRDGWLWTGDVGYMDEEGYIFIVDRSKDMIISGGENIYPREIEEVLYTHPSIADVAVIGVPSDKWGEDVKACVVTKPDATLSADEVIAFCRENLAHYKCPKTVDFIDALPRNLSGKILKKELRAPYWEGHDRQVS